MDGIMLGSSVDGAMVGGGVGEAVIKQNPVVGPDWKTISV